MADETTTETTVTAETKEELIKCPCCGEMTLRKPLDTSKMGIVLDEYMASIISGVPFTHTYTVYDNIDITVEVPLKREAQALHRAVQNLEQLRSTQMVTPLTEGINPGAKDKADKLRDAAMMVQVYANITSIVTKKDGRTVKMYTPAEIVKTFLSTVKDVGNNIELIVESYETADTPDNLSTVPELMLQAITATHARMYQVLMDTGFNENFWKGIELA